MMSSDKLANVRKPVVSLDLALATNSGSQKVALELDKDELKQMIQSLESANRVGVVVFFVSSNVFKFERTVIHEVT